LFDGYRRLDPGLDYLVPGNGSTAIKQKAAEWARAFRAGDAEYQTDEKWYAAAKLHDELVEQARLAGVGAGGQDGGATSPSDILEGMGLGPSAGPGSAGDDPATLDGPSPTGQPPSGTPPAQESEQERQERFKSGAEELADLSAEYSLPSVGNIKIAAYLVKGTRVTTPDGVITPVYLSARRAGAGFYAFIDEQSSIFSAFGADIADVLLAEVAYHLKTRSGSGEPLSKLIDELKSRHLPDRKLDGPSLSAAARDVFTSLTDRFADSVAPEAGSSIWVTLADSERAAIVARAMTAGETLENAGSSPEYLRYLPALLVPRVVERHPEVILNGTVLAPNYAALSPENTEARLILKERAVSYLTDLALLADAAGTRTVAELRRGQYTIELARQLLAGAQLSAAAA
jgi:hypothetical protein